MKLVVFAHVPPPHHGQSYMVQLMLRGFGGDQRGIRAQTSGADNDYGITCYHVNARLSRDLEQIGELRPKKILLLFRHCLAAIWCRFRYGAKALYYIPAPGKRSAMFRDWMVMSLCRPFFPKIILHWHAAGLSKWIETSVQIRARSFTYRCMKQADLSVILSRHNRADAEKLLPQKIELVANGIPDPCPDFDTAILPLRLARQEIRRQIRAGKTVAQSGDASDPHTFEVLYLAHCTRDKGVFDAIAGALKANEKLTRDQSPITIRLSIAGGFFNKGEEEEFNKILEQPGAKKSIRYLGFVSGAEKDAALKAADLFCFPTYYQNENQPVNLIEALAYGLPVVTTRWRSVPETLPDDIGLVNPRHPDQIAEALVMLMSRDYGDSLRQHFLKNFKIERHLEKLAAAFHSIE